MPKFSIILLSVLFILTSCASSKSTNNNFSNYRNINSLLMSKFGWNRNQIGPFGQSYKIDIDKSNNRSFLTLHNLVKKKYGGNAKTYICDLFSKNGIMVIKNQNILNSNYSESEALKARKKYMLTGELSETEWALVDQKSWLTYISEGTGSSEIKQSIFNKELIIKSCTPHHTIVSVDKKEIKFPNLILTMPTYIFLDPSTIQEKKLNTNLSSTFEDMAKLAQKSGEKIADGMASLMKAGKITNKEGRNFYNKMFKGKVKPINLVFVGAMCEDLKVCENLILKLKDLDRIDVVLDSVRQRLMKK